MSKRWFDVAYCTECETHYLDRFSNDCRGFEKFYEAIVVKTKILCTQWFVCLENTGSYSKPLSHWLFAKGIPFREENPLKINRSVGIWTWKE